MKKLVSVLTVIALIIPICCSCRPERQAVEIAQHSFYPDGQEVYHALDNLYHGVKNGLFTDESFESETGYILELMRGWEYYGDGNIGGNGYTGTIYRTGDYIADSDDSFKAAIESADDGEVIFIPSGVTIDLSDLSEAEGFTATLSKGVIIASDRGVNEGGTIRFSHPSGSLLICRGRNTVTGLNLQGVSAASGQSDSACSDNGIAVMGKNITVTNCEISGFTNSGVMTFGNSGVTVSQCFIHNCGTALNDRAGSMTYDGIAFFANGIDIKTKDVTVELPDDCAALEKCVPEGHTDFGHIPDLTTAVFAADNAEVYALVKSAAKAGLSDALGAVTEALSVYAGTSKYYYYLDSLTAELNGKLCGASADDSPIGGGYGTADIITSGDYTVTDLDSLISALGTAGSGDVVYIPSGIKIDMTGCDTLSVPDGVTLASDRGSPSDSGSVSTGALLYSTRRQNAMFTVGSGATVSGLTVVGADTERHMSHLIRGYSGGSDYTAYYYSLALTRGFVITGDGAEITNCEISGFSEGAVIAENAGNLSVNHCYIHHNQRNGFGYGVCISGKSTAVIEYNLFNFDRHSVAADGSAGSGYTASNNIHMGTAIYHVFDAHGGADRGDGTETACDYVDIYSNTILTDTLPYKKRGIPTMYSFFHENVVLHPEKWYEWRFMYGTNFRMENNVFGIADEESPAYSFDGGAVYSFSVDKTYGRPVSGDRCVVMVSGTDSIDSAGYSLRYAYFLAFTPTENGYYISEYGNNLDDGSIHGWNEKVDIPDGGFVLVFRNGGDENAESAVGLYNAISDRNGYIYNTSRSLYGDYIAVYENGTVTVTEAVTE